MDTYILAGYAAAILIGLSLGLIGGGGSILTVPVLVYLIGVDVVQATAYSLFVVGIASAVGVVSYARKQQVRWQTALWFGLPSIVAVYVTRRWLVPALPDVLWESGGWEITRDSAILALFALLMVLASLSMIRKKRPVREQASPRLSGINLVLLVALEGLIVGVLTGLVGAGGGFLIIPALVVLVGLPMKEAVGTSLLVIAAKSLIGFLGDLSNLSVDWSFLSLFSAIAVAGIFLGSYWSTRISGERLKPAFGWFVLVMGIYILGASLSGNT